MFLPVGALLGHRESDGIHVESTFDIIAKISDKKLTCNTKIVEERFRLFKKVRPDHEIVGYFRFGDYFPEYDTQLVGVIKELANDKGIVAMLLRKDFDMQAKALPINMYFFDAQDNMPEPSVIQFSLHDTPAESVAVENLSRVQLLSESQSLGTQKLKELREALIPLHSRISSMLLYLKRCQKGEIHADPCIIRHIGSILNQVELNKLHANPLSSNSMLTTYLASLTKDMEIASELVEKSAKLSGIRQLQGGSSIADMPIDF